MRKVNNQGEVKATCTSLVEEAMRQWDDFLNTHQLVQLTGCTSNQVTAALHSLQHYEVVDAVVAHNVPFWFLTGADTRTKTVASRMVEEPGSRRRVYAAKRNKPVRIDGVIYGSLTEATNSTGLSKVEIRIAANSNSNPKISWA